MELILGYRAGRGDGIAALTIAVGIKNMQGYPLMCLGNRYVDIQLLNLPPEGELVCRIPTLPLQPGHYYATLSCNANGVSSDKLGEAIRFEVLPGIICGISTLPLKKHGDFLLKHEWNFNHKPGMVTYGNHTK
jgi:lipopolysaccharide transport system ATP-binding protein